MWLRWTRPRDYLDALDAIESCLSRGITFRSYRAGLSAWSSNSRLPLRTSQHFLKFVVFLESLHEVIGRTHANPIDPSEQSQ